LVAGATTLFVVGIAPDAIAYRNPSLKVAVEAAVGVIAVMAALLVRGRFRERPTLSSVALFYAFSAYAVTNLFFSAAPASIATSYPEGVASWVPTLGAFVGTALLATAAFAGDRRITRGTRARIDRIGAVALIAATVDSIILLAIGPPEAGTAVGPSQWGWEQLSANPAIAVQAVVAIVFFAAAIGFTRTAQRDRDPFMAWLAAAAVFGGFARLNYFLLPSVYSDWIYAGDVLRACSYLLLFIGTAREITVYQRRAADTAMLQERRRIARDLHDGLAQELAFIVAQTRQLSATDTQLSGGLSVTHLATAAERALDESRRAILALSEQGEEPFVVTLAHEVEEVAARAGVEVEIRVPDHVSVDPQTREALLRIVREAVANAAQHGHAHLITVELLDGKGVHLRVVDDGAGFDSDDVDGRRGSFGLASMRERARLLGGDLQVSSLPGNGTTVEVLVP
jgi:signal transduction histidine kinase